MTTYWAIYKAKNELNYSEMESNRNKIYKWISYNTFCNEFEVNNHLKIDCFDACQNQQLTYYRMY